MNAIRSIPEFMGWLDSFGFDVGDYRISIYRALLIVAVGAGVLVSGWFINMFVKRMFRRMTRLDGAEQLLGEKLVGIVVWLGLILIGIDILGISLTALTVFSGAIGLAVGFGLQKTFGNLISGIILLMDRSIKPGDVIAVGDGTTRTFGQVNRIGIRAVSVITRDQIEYIIPNELLMTSQVENWSFSSRDVRIRVPVGVAYSSDIELVERLLLEAARELPRLRNLLEPTVWVTGFGPNAIDFEVQVWIDDPEVGIGDLRSDLLKLILKKFRANGVEIPFPQQDVHIRDWPPRSEGDS
ncbi:mechanosensitive ion channel family protein [Novosphingobium sp.]|uniref:mechanosensitive ion channel family protein n=1 Tax=Novosphingobium sp. TaxID=1874826 RepID=UPI0035B15594